MANDQTESRRRLLEDFEHSLFRLVMHDVALVEGQDFLKENEQLKSSDANLPSGNAICTYEKALKKNIRHQKQHPRKGTSKLFYRISIALAVLVIVSLTSILTVEAVRIRFLNLMIEVEEKYTTIRLQDENSAAIITLDNESWSGCFRPTYIPDGYYLTYEYNKELTKQLTYENEQGKAIHYSQFSSSTSVSLDSENASVMENIKVNGFDGLLIIKGEHISIAWSDREHIFTVLCSVTRAEAERIAQSVKIVE